MRETQLSSTKKCVHTRIKKIEADRGALQLVEALVLSKVDYNEMHLLRTTHRALK